MLMDWQFQKDKREARDCRERLKARRTDLAALQQPLKEAKLPVIVLVEGWGAAGKGSVIHSLIRELDPRFFKVRSVGMPTAEEQRWPFLKRHFETIPEEGKILFLDSGWMDETVRERMRRDLSDQEYQRRLESIRVFERQLAAGGYLLVKLFLHISQETQEQRLEKLAEDKDTAWRVGENDRKQNKNYDKALEAFEEYLTATDFPWAPWNTRSSVTLSAPSWMRQTGSMPRFPTLSSAVPVRSSPAGPGRWFPSRFLRMWPWTRPWRKRTTIKPSSAAAKSWQSSTTSFTAGRYRWLSFTKAGMPPARAAISSVSPLPWIPGLRGAAHCQSHSRRAAPPVSLAVLDPSAQNRSHCHL